MKTLKYIKRAIAPVFKEYIANFPVVGLTGPRQSGKSTFLQHELPTYTYVSFDDVRIRNFFAEDPHGFIEQYKARVIFDEVQKVPEIFNMLKLAVDNDRQNYGKYVVTGSSQFKFMKHVSESLAGRIGLLSLLPFQFMEIPTPLRTQSIYQGGYPELVTREYNLAEEWYTSYIDTYIDKDLRDVSNIGNLRDFQRFLKLLAINTSQPMNFSEYAKDIGVSVPTIKHWLSVLEASYIVFLLPPYYKNYGKRITKMPKLYFYDTGLVSHFTAVNSEEQFKKGPMCGAIFENYIVAEIMKKITNGQIAADLFYYRTGVGDEIDLIVDYKNRKDLLEIKYTSTSNANMFNAMKKIMEKDDQAYLLYNGKEFVYAKDVRAINYKDYLGTNEK